MGLVDSHAHLTDAHLAEDLDGVLTRAAQAGVEQIISIASDVADTARAIDLARRYEGVFATAGIHPHEAAKTADGDFAKLESLLSEDQVVALGEIGLDYHYDFADRQTQQAVFAGQLRLGAERSLPLVIHCREALADTVRLLNEHGFADRPVVFHCFSGSVEDAAVVADHGWRLSFTGLVTYKSAKSVQEVARTYPADRLMIETDAPYMSPVPMRGRFPNEPAHLIHTAKFLAELTGCPVAALIGQTAANTREFFGLPDPA
ncbi:MAG: TatD family hydrolase [Phycisphaerae bacterium]